MKGKIDFNNDKFHAKSTTYKLVHSIIVSIGSSLVIYLALLYAQNQSRPISLRLGEAILGTMIDIAPPIFWTLIAFSVGMIGVVQYSILLVKEKKAKNIENASKNDNEVE